METILTENTFKDKLISLFDDNFKANFKHDTPYIHQIRRKAMEVFAKIGFPHTYLEEWRSTNLTKPLEISPEIIIKQAD